MHPLCGYRSLYSENLCIQAIATVKQLVFLMFVCLLYILASVNYPYY